MNSTACPSAANVSAHLPKSTFYRMFYFPDWNKEPLHSVRMGLSGITFVFLMLGTLGNILVLPTLWRYRSLKISTRIFFFGMAISDNIGMPLNMFYMWYTFQFAADMTKAAGFLCSVYHFISNWAMVTSYMSLAAIAVERCLLVAFPQKMRTSNPKLYGAIVIVILVFISLGGTFTNLGYVITEDCVCLFVWPPFFMKLRYYCLYMIYTIVVGNIFISVFALWRILSKQTSKVKSSESSDAMAAVKMALAVGLFQMLCIMPYILYNVKVMIMGLSNYLISEGSDQLIQNICLMILTLNFGANFYIYMIVCRGFRESFQTFLPKRRNRKVEDFKTTEDLES